MVSLIFPPQPCANGLESFLGCSQAQGQKLLILESIACIIPDEILSPDIERNTVPRGTLPQKYPPSCINTRFHGIYDQPILCGIPPVALNDPRLRVPGRAMAGRTVEELREELQRLMEEQAESL